MQPEVNEFMDYVKHELSRGIGDWEQRLSTALVKSSPTDLVRRRRVVATPKPTARNVKPNRKTPSSATRPSQFAFTNRLDVA